MFLIEKECDYTKLPLNEVYAFTTSSGFHLISLDDSYVISFWDTEDSPEIFPCEKANTFADLIKNTNICNLSEVIDVYGKNQFNIIFKIRSL